MTAEPTTEAGRALVKRLCNCGYAIDGMGPDHGYRCASVAGCDAILAIEQEARADDLTLDGTDGAHPAWWRGSDHGVAAERRRIAEAVRELWLDDVREFDDLGVLAIIERQP